MKYIRHINKTTTIQQSIVSTIDNALGNAKDQISVR